MTTDDQALLAAVTDIATAAGDKLLAVFSPDARPADRGDLITAGQRNEDIVLGDLQPALLALRPGSRWVEDDQEIVPLEPGEWWAVDAVEGNVNHVHGLPEWCVVITLLRDDVPVLTVVRQPIGDLTYTAVQGGGAFLNGTPLHVGPKTDLSAAVVVTGPAEADQEDTPELIGASITAMLRAALLVRAEVPSTFPMLLVAAGQTDAFWQYEPVLPGIAAGILLITEAGGVVSRVDGSPWRTGAPDILVTTPALQSAAVDVLAKLS